MSEISKMLRVSNGNITGIVDKLTDEGLALRVAVPGDRRAQLVRLTPKGVQVFNEHAAPIMKPGSTNSCRGSTPMMSLA